MMEFDILLEWASSSLKVSLPIFMISLCLTLLIINARDTRWKTRKCANQIMTNSSVMMSSTEARNIFVYGDEESCERQNQKLIL